MTNTPHGISVIEDAESKSHTTDQQISISCDET